MAASGFCNVLPVVSSLRSRRLHKARCCHLSSRVSFSCRAVAQICHADSLPCDKMVLCCGMSVTHTDLCSRSYFRAATIRSHATQLRGAEQVTLTNTSSSHGCRPFPRQLSSKEMLHEWLSLHSVSCIKCAISSFLLRCLAAVIFPEDSKNYHPHDIIISTSSAVRITAARSCTIHSMLWSCVDTRLCHTFTET